MSKKITTDTAIKKRIKGISRMTKEKHNYDGFAVRRSLHNHTFLRYEGAGGRKYPGDKEPQRFAVAEELALLALERLDAILQDSKSWRTVDDTKNLTKKSQLALSELGFKMKLRAQ